MNIGVCWIIDATDLPDISPATHSSKTLLFGFFIGNRRYIYVLKSKSKNTNVIYRLNTFIILTIIIHICIPINTYCSLLSIILCVGNFQEVKYTKVVVLTLFSAYFSRGSLVQKWFIDLTSSTKPTVCIIMTTIVQWNQNFKRLPKITAKKSIISHLLFKI